MKAKAAVASIMAVVAVGALAACSQGEAPAPAEASAQAWVRKKVVLYLPDRVMKERVAVADLSGLLTLDGLGTAMTDLTSALLEVTMMSESAFTSAEQLI